MAVVTRPLRGEPKIWIDRIFTYEDGTTRRYRKIAKAQTPKGAKAEEEELIAYWGKHQAFPSDKRAAPSPAPKLKAVTSPLWEDAVEHFESNVLPSRKETTRRGYLALLHGPYFKYWDARPLSEITYRTIQAWDLQLIEAALSPSTRRNHHIVLRTVIKSVGPVEDEPGVLLTTLPRFPSLPRVGQGAVEATSPEEVDLLLRSVTHVGLRTAIAIAAYGGLRAGEIRALTAGDIDLKANKISISKSRGIKTVSTTKSGDARTVPLSSKVKAILEPILDGLANTDLVSVNEDGGPWNSDGLSLAYRRWAKRLGLKSTRFHSLRHHFATQCFSKANLPAINVKDLLGHSDLKTTQRYAHSSFEVSATGVAAL